MSRPRRVLRRAGPVAALGLLVAGEAGATELPMIPEPGGLGLLALAAAVVAVGWRLMRRR